MPRPPGSTWGMSSDTTMDWRIGAACRGATDPDAWIVKKAEMSVANELALRICLGCPVMEECRRWYDSLDPIMRQSVIAGGVRWSGTGKPVLYGNQARWRIACFRCGKLFPADYPHARYCSDDCYLLARRARRRLDWECARRSA